MTTIIRSFNREEQRWVHLGDMADHHLCTRRSPFIRFRPGAIVFDRYTSIGPFEAMLDGTWETSVATATRAKRTTFLPEMSRASPI